MSSLTPAVRFDTNAPFPTYARDKETGQVVLEDSPKRKIIIESCAEFMDYNLPGSKFGASGDFTLFHDIEGQPLVLSLSTQKRLLLCAHVNGGSGSWQTFDITPAANFEPSLFNVSQSPDNSQLLIAVSGVSGGKTQVYRAEIANTKLVADNKGKVQSSPLTTVSWAEIGAGISARKIKTLVCQHLGGAAKYRIVAGVEATKCEGSHFIYSPSSREWELVTFPMQTHSMRSVVAANLPGLGEGYVVLIEDKEGNASCFFEGEVSKQIFLKGLVNPRKLFTSKTRTKLTDIVVAAENGVGFIDIDRIDQGPKILLKGIDCASVLAFERGPKSLKDPSTVLVYAVSTHGELYVVEGSRDMKKTIRLVEFPSAAPIPIRGDVRSIAGNINPVTKAFETVYVSRDHDALRLLARDPVTTLWTETPMIVRSPQGRDMGSNTKAFLVTISLTNGNGTPVPFGYKVQLSTQPTLAYINDRSYNLSRKPHPVPVDRNGQLHVVIPADDSLACAPLELSFVSGETKVFKIQTAQRILNQFGMLKSAEDLANARGADSRPLLPNLDKNDPNVSKVAEVFGKLPDIVAHAESDGTKPPPSSKDLTIAWVKDEEKTKTTSTSWISEAVDCVGEAIGDVIEFVKNAVKKVVKLALRIVGPIVEFVIEISGRAIRFVLDTVSTIVNSVCYLLEGVFGLDLSAIKNWVAFRYIQVHKTQQEIANFIINGLDIANDYLDHNQDVMESALNTLGQSIDKNLVGKPPVPKKKEEEKSSSDGFGLGNIINNPIVSNLLKLNPMKWIWEAVGEELGSSVSIPKLELDGVSYLFEKVKEQLDAIVKFLKNSLGRFQEAMEEPETLMTKLHQVAQNGFWTAFETIKSSLISLYVLIKKSFKSIAKFCTETWTIPYITSFWKLLTGTDFTVVNFISYFIAQVMELGNSTSKPLLEGLGLATLLEKTDTMKMPSLMTGLGAEGHIEKTRAVVCSAEPSDAVRYILAFARISKVLCRTSCVVLEGVSQGAGGSGGEGEAAKAPEPEKEMSKTDMVKKIFKKPEDDDGDDDGDKGLSADSFSAFEISGVKSAVVGINAFGFSCRAVEQFILLNYFDEKGRQAQNYNGNNVEMAGSLVGFLLSFFSDKPHVLALSNIATSVGAFAGKCMAPKYGVNEISEMIGSSGAALASGLFLSPDPYSQTIAWVGTGLDGANAVTQFVTFLVAEQGRRPKRGRELEEKADGLAKKRRVEA